MNTNTVIETDDLPPEPPPPPPPDLPPPPPVPPPPPPPLTLEAQAERAAMVLRAAIQPVMVRAERYVCDSPAEYEDAATILAELGRMEESVHARLDGLIADAFAVHRGLTSLRGEMLDPILERVRLVKQRAANWRAAEERRAADEAARQIAEQQRIDRERSEQTALALEDSGEHDAATQLREEARTAPAPAIAAESHVPKTPGLGLVGTFEYGFEIVSRDLIPEEYWIVDEAALGAVVRRQKEACTIPGIRVTKTPATRYRKNARAKA